MGQENPSKVLAIFDFDGTITNKDTFFEFLILAVGKKQVFMKFLKLFYTFFAYQLNLVSGDYAKEKVIRKFFKDMEVESFICICEDFAKNHIPSMVKKSALEKINWHKKQRHRVVVLSASLEHYISPWCIEQKIECIGTILEMENNKLTGRYKGINCHGPGKVIKLKERFSLDDFDSIYGYGNGRGDKEFLQLATHKFFRNFK